MLFDRTETENDESSNEAITEIDPFIGDKSSGRYFALFLDGIIAPAIAYTVIVIPGGLFSGPIKFAILILVYLLYFIITEAVWSRSIGKMICGLIVVNKDLEKISLKQSIIRNLARLLDTNPLIGGLLVGGAFVLFSRRKQRIGDMLAGTIVISYYKYKTRNIQFDSSPN